MSATLVSKNAHLELERCGEHRITSGGEAFARDNIFTCEKRVREDTWLRAGGHGGAVADHQWRRAGRRLRVGAGQLRRRGRRADSDCGVHCGAALQRTLRGLDGRGTDGLPLLCHVLCADCGECFDRNRASQREASAIENMSNELLWEYTRDGFFSVITTPAKKRTAIHQGSQQKAHRNRGQWASPRWPADASRHLQEHSMVDQLLHALPEKKSLVGFR